MIYKRGAKGTIGETWKKKKVLELFLERGNKSRGKSRKKKGRIRD
jgi:hypothetical protein